MPNRPSPTPVVIDADPGIDDVVALALATRSPTLEVVAVTTSYGNATLDATTRNARALLELVDRPDIPVLPGADRPLSRPLTTAPETHGPTGVGYAAVGPAPDVRPEPEVLSGVLADAPAAVVLVTLGPLTNLAHALEADAAATRAKTVRHLGMFGNIGERGNTNRWADFNAWCDPEATERVLRGGLATTMVGLDVTRRMTVASATVARLTGSPDPVVRWLAEALRFYVEFHRAAERLDGCVINDVLPIGELLRPGLLSVRRMRLATDLDESEHRGHTREHVGGSPTDVAMGVDVAGMTTLLERVFGSGWAGAAHESRAIDPADRRDRGHERP